MKNLFFCWCVILSCFFCKGQNIDFSDINFEKNEKGLTKDVLKDIQRGDAYYYHAAYTKALNAFQRAHAFNSDNSLLNAKVGACLFYKDELMKATKFLNVATKLDANLDGYFLFLMAKIYHKQNNFPKAIEQYKLAKKKGSKINPNPLSTIDKEIKACNYAEEFVKDSLVKITNLGKAINTKNHEYVPVITADQSTLFFTSRRENTIGNKIDIKINDYFEDIYVAVKRNDSIWNTGKNIGYPINTRTHDATIGWAKEGEKLLIYRDNKKGGGDIYLTEKKENSWSKPTKFPKPINSKYHETSACFDQTGKTLFFVSDRPGGKGGKDIYKVTQKADGSWGEIKNLGNNINSSDDEDAIFLHPNGNTLYFSSNGKKTIGGYDIFKSEFDPDKKKWGIPVNMGFPINSGSDDVCFVITPNEEYAYFSSSRAGGEGKKDIYQAAFLEVIAENAIPPVTLLKGIIFDNKSKKPLQAPIEIYNTTSNELVTTYESDSVSGKYAITLVPGFDYTISIKNRGYLFHSEEISINDSLAFKEVEKNIGLNKLEVGEKVELKNIFYEYNKASLGSASFEELDKVVELMNTNPDLKLELGSHSDSRGSSSYNLKLSKQRAQSCVVYLTSKGVEPSRLNSKGYGETTPIITDNEIVKMKTEEEKENAYQRNRRTEFKILGNN